MNKLSVTLLLFYTVSGFTQEPTLEWVKQLGVSTTATSFDLALDSKDCAYITGHYSGTLDLDPGPGIYNVTATPGWHSMFVAKYDSDGHFIWGKSFSGNEGVEPWALTVDYADDVIITGHFWETADFDPGTATHTLTSNGMDDIFVVKLDSYGNFIWAQNIGGTQGDQGLEIGTDAAGHIFTTGYFQDSFDFDFGAGTTVLAANGSSDVFVCKMDPSGNFEWAREFGGESSVYDMAWTLTVDKDGNVITAGVFDGMVDFDPGPATHYLTPAADGYPDCFVSKLDPAGNFLWAAHFSGFESLVTGYSVVTDTEGNVFTTGAFYGTVDFDPDNSGTDIIYSSANDQTFVNKISADGNYFWTKTTNGDPGAYNWSVASAIALDTSDNIYVTGYYDGTVDFDPSPSGTHLIEDIGAEYDGYIWKLDTLGNFCWVKELKGTGVAEGYGIAVSESGNIYTTGNFVGMVDFLPGAGTSFLYAGANLNAFLHKMGPCPVIDNTTSLTGTLISSNMYESEYQWIDCNNGYQPIPGAVGYSYSPSTTGSYAVIIMRDICSDTSDCVDVVITPNTSGLTESALTNLAEVTPNPTTGTIALTLFSEAAVSIHSLSGQMVYNPFQAVGPTTLDLSFLENGTYFIHITKQDEKQVLKLIIAH